MQWDLGTIKSLLAHMSGDRSAIDHLEEVAKLKEALAKAIASPKGEKSEIEAAELAAMEAQDAYQEAVKKSGQKPDDTPTSTLDELLNQVAKRVGFGS